MSLHWYIEERPKNKRLIKDIEGFSTGRGFERTEFTKLVLEKIEHGEFIDNYVFRDRTGYELKFDCLSTSSKILLSIEYYPDLVFDCMELGWNCFDLLPLLREGNVYFERFRHRLSTIHDSVDMSLNGKLFNDIEDFNEEVDRVACIEWI